MSTCIVLFAATTAERFFRIDQAQEHLHYATDIFSEELFIVYAEVDTEDEAVSSGVSVRQDRCLSHMADDNLPTEKILLLSRASDSSGHRPLHRINASKSVQ